MSVCSPNSAVKLIFLGSAGRGDKLFDTLRFFCFLESLFQILNTRTTLTQLPKPVLRNHSQICDNRYPTGNLPYL